MYYTHFIILLFILLFIHIYNHVCTCLLLAVAGQNFNICNNIYDISAFSCFHYEYLAQRLFKKLLKIVKMIIKNPRVNIYLLT